METFIAEYTKQLELAVKTYPAEYQYPVTEVPKVVARMRPAFEAGTFDKGGRAVKATCKALGIAHSYKAIACFIINHQ